MPPLQADLFSDPMVNTVNHVGPITLRIGKIQAPRTLAQIKKAKKGEPIKINFHVPSFKNAKHWITKTPQGKPLDRPFLITSPEFQKWMEKAAISLESQLLSWCQTTYGETLPARSRLLLILSLLPADDSVRELPAGSWEVKHVPPGEEGAIITLEKLP